MLTVILTSSGALEQEKICIIANRGSIITQNEPPSKFQICLHTRIIVSISNNGFLEN